MSDNSLDKHGNSHQRRRLLCIFLLFVSTVLLAACQVTQATPTPILSTTPTTTATSTATRTPTITPSPAPTETATITPTPTPIVIAEPWERSREDKDKALAQLMFPFIGGISHINRRGIDLRYGDLNIASIHDSQIDPSKDVQNLRETYAGKLNQDPQLLDQLASIRAQLEGIANVTVVIENGQITQVATKPYQTIIRYVLENNGTLREMTAEEEPLMWSAIEIIGSEFYSEGKKINLTGVVFPHFQWKNEAWGTHNKIRQDIDSLVANNGNVARFGFNGSYVSDPKYIESLINGIEYARQNGLRIILGMGARGEKNGDIKYPEDVFIERDGTNIMNDWKILLENREILDVIKRDVDIINPVFEPCKYTGGNVDIPMNQWTIIAEKMIDLIRTEIGYDIAIGISPTWWGNDYNAANTSFPNRNNIYMEIHPYKKPMEYKIGNTNRLDEYISQQLLSGRAVFIGEFGWDDPPMHNSELLKIIDKYDIPFMAWGWISGEDYWIVSPNGNPRLTGEQILPFLKGIDF